MKPLVLFDIDGTLTQGCHIHGTTFGQALSDVCKVKASIWDIDPRGMTDKQIVRELLLIHTNKADDTTISKVLRRIVEIYTSGIVKEKIKLSPGVKELLAELNGKAAFSLITGNVEEIAWLKLKKVGIDHYFKTGGFGSEGWNRWEVAKRSIEKAEALNKVKFKQIFNIGDTVLDVKQGKILKTVTIAVSTGDTSYEDLKAQEPEYLFKDLSDYRQIAGIIEGKDG